MRSTHHNLPWRLLAVTASLVVAGGGLAPTASAAVAPNGRIAFERAHQYFSPDGHPFSAWDIHASEADGTGQVSLTASAPDRSDDVDPAYSPDGTRIAFASDRDGNYDIYTMAADGSDVRQMTFTYGKEYEGGYVEYDSSLEPTWSPDGSQIAFTGSRPSKGAYDREVWVVSADGSGQERRVTGPGREANDVIEVGGPDWSPNGSALLYTKGFDWPYVDVYSIGVDGTGETNLTPDFDDAADSQAAWSPDGARIAFTSMRSDGTNDGLPQEDVWVMNADGTGLRQFSTNPGYDREPDWSPDGTQLIWTSDELGPWMVVTAPAPAPAPALKTATTSRSMSALDMTVSAAAPTGVVAGEDPSWQPLPGPATQCTVRGTPKADTLRGTAGRDVLCGLGGADVLIGLGNGDILRGGDGADSLYGRGGADTLEGGLGNDLLDGGLGTDVCRQGRGTGDLTGCEG